MSHPGRAICLTNTLLLTLHEESVGSSVVQVKPCCQAKQLVPFPAVITAVVFVLSLALTAGHFVAFANTHAMIDITEIVKYSSIKVTIL